MTTKITKALNLIFFILFAHLSSAQVYVNQAATGANDGSTWTDAYTDLTAAIENTTSGAIWVASGTYLPSNTDMDTFNRFAITEPVSLYGGFIGTEASIDERTPGNETILSGDINGDDIDDNFNTNKEDNIFHVMSINVATNDPVIVDGFTFTGGNTSVTNNDTNINWAGGAIYAASTIEVNACNFNNNFARTGGCIYISSPINVAGDNSKITNCTFEKNSTFSQSAGIYSENIDGLTVSDCTFSSNRTVRGALYPLFCTNILIDNCTFANNAAPADGFGGALFIWSSRGEIKNTTFAGNQAGNAGGIYFDGREDIKDATNMVFDNCTFTTNICSGFGGGAIYAFRSSYTMLNSTFVDNASGNSGGAIFNGGGNSEIIMMNNSFSENNASFGASHANYGIGSEVTITNNTYTENEALTSGGAMTNGFGAKVELSDCTFNSNFARFGGAIYNQNDTTSLSIDNSIFQANSGLDGAGAVQLGGPVNLTVTNSTFDSNMGNFGGAISGSEVNDGEFGEATVTIDKCIIINNRASTQGAGINLIDFDLNMTNSILGSNLNLGEGAGGGLSLNSTDSSTVNVSITHSTIAENFALLGAGIATFTTDLSSNLNITMTNNILANQGVNYQIEAGTPSLTSQGGNLSTDDSTVEDFTGTGDINEVEDAQFVDVGELDFTLEGGSPAINIGVETNILTDILGNPRSGAPDAGAYEKLLDATEDILENDGQLTIAPNVTSNQTTVKLDNNWSGNIELQILDVNGKSIMINDIMKSGNTTNHTIDVSLLSSGTYYMMVRSNDEVLTSQFTKI